jgi:hypothetical protein
MPSGIFPVPEFRPIPAHTHPTLAARTRMRWTRERLDEELARGADPGKSAQLMLRAAQLRSRSERSRLANALVAALGDARGANLGAFRMKTRRQQAVIREYADDVLALVGRLRDDRPVETRGVAMAARLVDDGASPLHRKGGQDLQHELRAVRFALDTAGAAAEDLAAAA